MTDRETHPVLQKKVCMLGAFATGKTSLVQRFVRSMFSEKYHTTVGVKIDKKQVEVDDAIVNMLLWDLAGEDDFQKIRTSYLRGASGFIFVVDGTRKDTLDRALAIRETAIDAVGDVPTVFALNKADLVEAWELDNDTLSELGELTGRVERTSAKTGDSVEPVFEWLARRMAAG